MCYGDRWLRGCFAWWHRGGLGHYEEQLEVVVHCYALDEADVGEDADVL